MVHVCWPNLGPIDPFVIMSGDDVSPWCFKGFCWKLNIIINKCCVGMFWSCIFTNFSYIWQEQVSAAKFAYIERTYGCESKRFGIEQVLVDIPFNTPFNTLLNRRVPIVQYPVQYPCSIPLFNKYPASILGTFCTAPCTAPWPDFATAVWTAPCTAPCTAPLPDFATAVWTAPCTAPCTVPLPDFATAVWTAPCTAPWVLGAWVIPTGVFLVFLCTRSDFPRGRELDDWFGYRFFEVVRSIPRSIPVQYPFNTSLWAFQLRCPAMPPKSVGCLFRKCPPFNTPRYPPVQYLPFNTPVQYPIEQKAAAYPPGTGGFDSQPYIYIYTQ